MIDIYPLEDARRACAVLGWQWAADPPGDPLPPTVFLRRYGKVNATTPHGEHVVTLPTLLLAAATRGAPALDLGECQECGGAGYEWRQLGSFMLGAAERLKENGWRIGPQRDDGLAPAIRPCSACRDSDDNATGRRVVSDWPEAVLRAAPRKCSECVDGERSMTNPRTGDVEDFPCTNCETGTVPGDPDARADLAALAAHLRAALDDIRARGFAPEPDRWHPEIAADALLGAGHVDALVLAECPALPAWIDAWLEGVCPACQGSTWNDDDEKRRNGIPGCETCFDGVGWTGLAIGPYLPAVRARVRALWEAETVECEFCDGSGMDEAPWTRERYEKQALRHDQARHRRHHGPQTNAERVEATRESFRKWWRSIDG